MNIINIHPKIKKRKKYSSYKGNIGKVADNILNRNFKAEKPNTKWATDITEFKINAGKVYAAVSPLYKTKNNKEIRYWKPNELSEYKKYVRNHKNAVVTRIKGLNRLARNLLFL